MNVVNGTLENLLRGEDLLYSKFVEEQAEKDSGLYLASCVQNEYLFVDDSFQKMTGYSTSLLLHHGLDRWATMVHEDDVEKYLDRLIRKCLIIQPSKGGRVLTPRPFALEYRMKHASGKWIWVNETKCILSYTEDKTIDKIIGSFEDITKQKIHEEAFFQQKIEDETCANGLLQLYRKIRNHRQEKTPPITRREIQVLELIGDGLSSKQIAGQLSISINTVESHRRHLIEKFQASNSADLIKKATSSYVI